MPRRSAMTAISFTRADVHCPECVLEQLGQFGGLRRGDGHDLVDDSLVEGDREVAARLGHPAHDLGGVRERVGRVAGIDALGAEGEEEVLPGPEAASLEFRLQQFAGRAGVGRGLEDDELPGPETAADLLKGVEDVGDVGVPGLRERGGDADDDRVHVAETAEVPGRVEQSRLHGGRDRLRRHVADVGAAASHAAHDPLVDVEAERPEARPGEGG